MENILYQSSFLNDDWQPRPGFSIESPSNVIRYWQLTVQESTTSMPRIDPRTQIRNANLLIAKFGYLAVLRTLEFMASPLSKFYQYPYSLNAVHRAYSELSFYKDNLPKETYSGFLGPIGLRNLLAERR